jgi:hypothetical protein
VNPCMMLSESLKTFMKSQQDHNLILTPVSLQFQFTLFTVCVTRKIKLLHNYSMMSFLSYQLLVSPTTSISSGIHSA